MPTAALNPLHPRLRPPHEPTPRISNFLPDMIGVERESMLSIGCIQAQRCHTDFCPAGIATHRPWLMKGLDPTLKAARLANYLCILRKEILKVCRSCGVSHPSEMKKDYFEFLDGNLGSRTVEEWLKGA